MSKDPSSSNVLYERRRPEDSVLYRLVQEHMEMFFDQIETQTGTGLPKFVRKEFDAFLDCGLLCNGFLRIHCDQCSADKLVAFSCKRRGFCPSCAGKRMAQTSTHWLENVIPAVPVRQWVLSVPIPLRYLLAAKPQMLTPVLAIIHRALSTFLCAELGLAKTQGQTGAVSVIQRFGSAANLNLHFHCLVFDGVYRCVDGVPQFTPLPRLDPSKLQPLLEKIILRILRCLTRHGLLVEEHGETFLAENADEDALTPLQWASCAYRIAFGPNAGSKLLSGSNQRPGTATLPPDCVSAYGFSLHAGTRCDAHQRDDLERLCRYITRPPIANERLSIDPEDGQVVLELKTPYQDGTGEITFSPLEFIGRLAALVPRPWINLVRYHGVVAPNAKWRRAIVPKPAGNATDDESAPTTTDSEWAMLLKRVFNIDVLACERCGGPMRIVAAITDPTVVQKILDHLGLPTTPPARSPPQWS